MVRAAAAIILMPGALPRFEKLFREQFVPAVSRYPGFREVWLLKSRTDSDVAELNVVFDSEEQRLHWVASADHDAAWAPLSECCRETTIGRFDVVVRATATPEGTELP